VLTAVKMMIGPVAALAEYARMAIAYVSESHGLLSRMCPAFGCDAGHVMDTRILSA
jgi:hypothetical protein